jgi:hypothetical protein
MAATDDPIAPVANSRILAKLIPDARPGTIDDGHLFLVTRPQDSARIIADSLGRGRGRMAPRRPPLTLLFAAEQDRLMLCAAGHVHDFARAETDPPAEIEEKIGVIGDRRLRLRLGFDQRVAEAVAERMARAVSRRRMPDVEMRVHQPPGLSSRCDSRR